MAPPTVSSYLSKHTKLVCSRPFPWIIPQYSQLIQILSGFLGSLISLLLWGTLIEQGERQTLVHLKSHPRAGCLLLVCRTASYVSKQDDLIWNRAFGGHFSGAFLSSTAQQYPEPSLRWTYLTQHWTVALRFGKESVSYLCPMCESPLSIPGHHVVVTSFPL